MPEIPRLEDDWRGLFRELGGRLNLDDAEYDQLRAEIDQAKQASWIDVSRRSAEAPRSARAASPRISIVIPALNEARNVEVILPQLPDVHEIILVDGHSVDDTVAAARRVRPDIRIVYQTRRGKGNALTCGFEAATGDVIVMFDADGSSDPTEIDTYVTALLEGADFAKGSRFRSGGGSENITRFRRLGNAGLNGLVNAALKTKYSDLCYGYNAFWADILPILDLPSSGITPIDGQSLVWGDGFEIETVLHCRIAAARLRVTEVASVEKLRIHGDSNLNALSDGLRVLQTVGAERRRATKIFRIAKEANVERRRAAQIERANEMERSLHTNDDDVQGRLPGYTEQAG